MKAYIRNWLHNLGAAVITGATSSALASVGIVVADAAGLEVKQLDYQQLLSVTCAGGVVGLLAYLKQSPLPQSNTNENP